MEAVVGAGEDFVVGHHQLGAKLLIVLADGFEDGALVFGGGIGGDRISKSGWVSNCGLASSPTQRTRAVGFEGFAQLRQLPAAWLQHPARLPHRRRRHHQAARLQVAQLLLMGLKLRVGLGRAAGHGSGVGWGSARLANVRPLFADQHAGPDPQVGTTRTRASVWNPHLGVRFPNLSPDEPLDAHLAFELFEQLGENLSRSLLLINWALGA